MRIGRGRLKAVCGGAEIHERMERTNPMSADRHEVIVRLRQQVADGAYEPPVDELINCLVNVVMARRAAGGAPKPQR